MISSGVGASPGVDLREKTGLWMLNYEAGGPAGLKETRVGSWKWKARTAAGCPNNWDSLIGPRQRAPLGGTLWGLALIC